MQDLDGGHGTDGILADVHLAHPAFAEHSEETVGTEPERVAEAERGHELRHPSSVVFAVGRRGLSFCYSSGRATRERSATAKSRAFARWAVREVASARTVHAGVRLLAIHCADSRTGMLVDVLLAHDRGDIEAARRGVRVLLPPQQLSGGRVDGDERTCCVGFDGVHHTVLYDRGAERRAAAVRPQGSAVGEELCTKYLPTPEDSLVVRGQLAASAVEFGLVGPARPRGRACHGVVHRDGGTGPRELLTTRWSPTARAPLKRCSDTGGCASISSQRALPVARSMAIRLHDLGFVVA